MLGSADLVAFAATTDLERALEFYGGALGLRLVESDDLAAVFDAHGTTLRITRVETLTPLPYTVLGWSVDDIRATVQDLAGRGVVFERFEAMEQDADGVWVSPGGAQVAWFHDPDGNVLSVTQG